MIQPFLVFWIWVWVLSVVPGVVQAQDGFTQKDRELLIRLEERLNQMDKRLELMNQRIEDLRAEMNKRFEQVDKRFEELREDTNNRFQQMISFLWILASIFAALVAVVIAFALWDRRTMIKRAKEEAINEIEKEGRLRDLIQALRKLARKNEDLARVLREFNLL